MATLIGWLECKQKYWNEAGMPGFPETGQLSYLSEETALLAKGSSSAQTLAASFHSLYKLVHLNKGCLYNVIGRIEWPIQA